MRRFAALICAAAGLSAGVLAAPAGAARTHDVQVLAINDFHGNLEPPSGSGGRIQVGPAPTDTVNAGGAAYLSTHLQRLREGNRRTITAGAGDLVGASPFISGVFHDEPTIEALNAMGLQVTGVGNHEFDEGYRELLRLQRGGCHPVDGCQDGDPFFGSRFQWLAANVAFLRTDRTILPRYWTRGVGGGVKVGFIGLTLEETPTIVTPAGIQGLEFKDEVATVNRYARTLARRGVRTIIVLLHQGGFQTGPYAKGFQDVNGCENFRGEIIPIVEALSRQVDAVASAHTHAAYNCRIDGKLVTSAASNGRLITEYRFRINERSRDVVESSATNHIVTRDVEPDPRIQAIIDEYKAAAAPIGNQVIGTANGDITRTANAAGESALGDLIADAQLAATSPPELGGAQIALMNPGGIRADLLAGEVTYAELFEVQPFGNNLVVKTMTGDQLRRVLEQQFDNPAAGQNRILQVSEGFAFSYDLTRAAGSRITSMTLGGTPIDPAATYRVTMNSFLASGGDNFTVFNEGTDPLGGVIDLDALIEYVKANGAVAGGPMDRITRVG